MTAAQGWLARAARSPRDAQWRCGHCGFVMQDWTSICSNCDAFDSLSWVAPRAETLEALPPGASVKGTSGVIEAKAIETQQLGSSGQPANAHGEDAAARPPPPDDPGIVERSSADSITDSESEFDEEYDAFGADNADETEKTDLRDPK